MGKPSFFNPAKKAKQAHPTNELRISKNAIFVDHLNLSLDYSLKSK